MPDNDSQEDPGGPIGGFRSAIRGRGGPQRNSRMDQKFTNSIPVVEYKLEGDVNFEEWIEKFESACIAATHPTDKNKTFLEWLPLKLDTNALRLYNSKTKDEYAEIKKELLELFADPHEAYRWKSDPKAYQWDGKETLNTVAANVIRKVNRNEKLLKDDAQKEAYFFRFRMAMPQKYKKAIDMGTTRSNKNIVDALDIALRLQMSERDDDPPPKSVEVTLAAALEPPSMQNRLKMLELEMRSLSTKIDGALEDKEKREKPQERPQRRGEGNFERAPYYYSPADKYRGRSESRDGRGDGRRDYSSSRDREKDFDRGRDREKRFTKRRDDRRPDRFPSRSMSRDRRDFSRERQDYTRDQRDDRRDDRRNDGRFPRRGWGGGDQRDSRDRRERDSTPFRRNRDSTPFDDKRRGGTRDEKNDGKKPDRGQYRSAWMPSADDSEADSDRAEYLAFKEAKNRLKNSKN